MKWKIYFFVLLVWTQTFAIAGYEGGMAAYEAKDYASALKEWSPLALNGNANAQYRLGIMFAHGEGIPKDEKKATEWLLKAANQRHAAAQNSLGFMYANGRGVPKNQKRAAEWYRQAAVQGNADAQYNLGTMYLDGQGVLKNQSLADEWFRKAAKSGHFAAQMMVLIENRGVQ